MTILKDIDAYWVEERLIPHFNWCRLCPAETIEEAQQLMAERIAHHPACYRHRIVTRLGRVIETQPDEVKPVEAELKRPEQLSMFPDLKEGQHDS